jgi:hypothetical protein
MLFGLPVVQIVLFGFALTNEVKNSKIFVVIMQKIFLRKNSLQNRSEQLF